MVQTTILFNSFNISNSVKLSVLSVFLRFLLGKALWDLDTAQLHLTLLQLHICIWRYFATRCSCVFALEDTLLLDADFLYLHLEAVACSKLNHLTVKVQCLIPMQLINSI